MFRKMFFEILGLTGDDPRHITAPSSVVLLLPANSCKFHKRGMGSTGRAHILRAALGNQDLATPVRELGNTVLMGGMVGK
jgi:hypothetical protein